MTTRVETGGPKTGVVTSTTAVRVTPAPARPFRQIMSEGERAVVGSAEAAVRRLPGGPILAAAFRHPGSTGTSGLASSAEGSAGTASAGRGSGSSIEGALAEQADRNLYYLELQQRISAESRAYSALSNVLKARHDTVKNAINNIR